MSADNRPPIDPRELAWTVRTYAEMLEQMVTPLGEPEEGEALGYRQAEGLTPMGCELRDSAEAVAHDIEARMVGAAGSLPSSAPAPIADLDYVAASTFGVVAAALQGIRHEPGDPLYVAQGIVDALRRLIERAKEAQDVPLSWVRASDVKRELRGGMAAASTEAVPREPEPSEAARAESVTTGNSVTEKAEPTPGRVDPQDLTTVVANHIDALQAILTPLVPGFDPGGYLTEERGENKLTQRGVHMWERAYEYAADAGDDLWKNAGTMRPSESGYRVLEDLAYDAGYTFQAIAAAMINYTDANFPTAVIGGVRLLLDRLREQCQGAEAATGDGEAQPSAEGEASEASPEASNA